MLLFCLQGTQFDSIYYPETRTFQLTEYEI
jgi:hypothetical protein